MAMPKLAMVQQQAAEASRELTDTMRTTRAEFERRLANLRKMADDFSHRQKSQRRNSRDGLRPVKP